tara:strand:+ start:338 stop:607 length:270 start_codon:yes stop_codon:yes gene_type:complete
MNGRKAKRIRIQAEILLVDWLKSLLSKEEGDQITLDSYKNFMPEQTHFMAQRTIYLNAYHPKWIQNKIKSILRKEPSRNLKTITFGELQ